MTTVADQLYLQALGFQEGEAGRMADAYRNQAGRELEFAEPLLQEQYKRNVFDVNASQEGRGMLRSGDTGRRQENAMFDAEASLGELYLGYDRQLLDIENQLSSTMAGTAMSRADIEAQSRNAESAGGPPELPGYGSLPTYAELLKILGIELPASYSNAVGMSEAGGPIYGHPE